MDNDGATRLTATAADGIPGYRISRLLDQGGMGGVYLAEDETLKRLVAIKLINPDLTENAEFKRRFSTEALIIAGFQHPNIVTVFASGWLQQKQYFVMEYVRGGTLKQRLESGPLEASEACRIAERMADALAYSHERNVIHRDFKPNNVLLRENGTPVLSDFGIAKSVVMEGEKTAFGVVVGSALYMAPEQSVGAEISSGVDIYSFGLVLHQMLAGALPERHPLRSKQEARQIARTLRGIDPACVDLIARCLQAAPQERPTAVECRQVLARVAATATPHRTSRLVPLAAAVLTVAALAAASAWRLGHFRAPASPRTVATSVEPAGPAVAAPVAEQIPAPAPVPAAVPAPAPAPSPAKAQPAAIRTTKASSTAAPAAAMPAGMVPLTVQVTPKSASLFLDGQPMASSTVPTEPGPHNVAAVAQGYYGNIHHVTLSDPKANPVDLTLEPTSLPSGDELLRFLKLSQNPNLTVALVQTVSERTLRESLRAQRLRQSNHDEEVQNFTNATNALRRFGDARAAVLAFLIEGMRVGSITRSLSSPALAKASDGGDALASFFQALSHRESFDSESAHLNGAGPQFHLFCRRMGMASAQGLAAVANQFSRLEHCTE
jgi:eukaryotic-like serine/threonine-protein kinase